MSLKKSQAYSSIRFIITFILAYLVLNSGYLLYIDWYEPNTDPATLVTGKLLINLFPGSSFMPIAGEPGIRILSNGQSLFNLKEGCNGISIFIALLSFILSFGKSRIHLSWYIPVSFLIIELSNLLRLVLLADVKLDYPTYFNLFHTYIFPSILYLIAFFLMMGWVTLSGLSNPIRKYGF